MAKRKRIESIQISDRYFTFTDEGVFIKQGNKTYKAEPCEVDGKEYFIVEGELTNRKIWIEVKFDS